MLSIQEEEYEALLQFNYMAPIGLAQTRIDGEIVMANPLCAQLLLPLSRDGELINLFTALESVAPDLSHRARDFGTQAKAEPSAEPQDLGLQRGQGQSCRCRRRLIGGLLKADGKKWKQGGEPRFGSSLPELGFEVPHGSIHQGHGPCPVELPHAGRIGLRAGWNEVGRKFIQAQGLFAAATFGRVAALLFIHQEVDDGPEEKRPESSSRRARPLPTRAFEDADEEALREILRFGFAVAARPDKAVDRCPVALAQAFQRGPRNGVSVERRVREVCPACGREQH